MSWTYDITQLATSKLYQVRFIIGDTIVADPLLQDEEINFILTQKESTIATSIECCDRIVSVNARNADYDLGPFSIKASQRVKNYTELAKKLQNRNIAVSGAPLFTDPSRIIFDVDMMNDSWCSHPEEEE